MLQMLALLQLTYRKNGKNRLKSIAFSMFLTFADNKQNTWFKIKGGRINYGNN